MWFKFRNENGTLINTTDVMLIEHGTCSTDYHAHVLNVVFFNRAPIWEILGFSNEDHAREELERFTKAMEKQQPVKKKKVKGRFEDLE